MLREHLLINEVFFKTSPSVREYWQVLMGLKILMPGVADNIQMGSFPSVKDMLDKTMEQGIEVYVCEASKQMLGLENVELIPGVKIVGAGTLNDLALDVGATMWF